MITAQQERDKYARMWAVPAYGVYSPGVECVSRFLAQAEFNQGDTLIDLGCGTGRAGLELARHGLQVYLFDHVRAVEPDNHLPFIEGNLWNLPSLIRFKWFFCADVMEHIPPEHVDATLAGIARIARQGFFQIAMCADSFGSQIGEKLHLTVENSSWWRSQLSKYFSIRSAEDEGSRFSVFVESLGGSN